MSNNGIVRTAMDAPTQEEKCSPTPCRADFGFAETVRREFEFLLEQGFSVVHVEPTLVCYAADRAFINVYHGRQSFELGVEIGMVDTGGPAGADAGRSHSCAVEVNREKFSIWEIARAMDAASVPETMGLQAASTASVALGLRRLAEYVKRYGEKALAGDAAVFAAVRESQKGESERYVLEGKLRHAREEIAEAWRKNQE